MQALKICAATFFSKGATFMIASLSLDYERNNPSSRKYVELLYFSLPSHNNLMLVLEIPGYIWVSECFFT